MSDKPRIGTESYMDDYPNHVGIFNSNYSDLGQKVLNKTFCWVITHQGKHWGGGFPSQQDATDYVREELINARVSQ